MDGIKIREEKEIKRDGTKKDGDDEKRRRKKRLDLVLSVLSLSSLSLFRSPPRPLPPSSLLRHDSIDFKIKKVLLDGQSVKLQIWDTAGQERFRTITASYYRGAMGILLVYDVGDRRSFESVRGWMRAVESNAVDGVVRVSEKWSFFEVGSERGRKKEKKSVVKKRRAVYSLPSFSTLFCAFFSPPFLFFSFSLSSLSSSSERKRARRRGREGERTRGGRKSERGEERPSGVCSPKRPARECEMAQGVFPPLPFVVGAGRMNLSISTACSRRMGAPLMSSALQFRVRFSLSQRGEKKLNSKATKQIEKSKTKQALVGNKADVSEEHRAVSHEQGAALAKEFGVPFFEASAKSGEGVEEAFSAVAREVVSRLAESGGAWPPGSGVGGGGGNSSGLRLGRGGNGGSGGRRGKSSCCS